MVGLKKGQTNSGSFKKGQKAWNKGKKCNWVTEKNLKNNPMKNKKAVEKMIKAKSGKGKGWISKGYKCKSINGKRYFEHHLVWMKANQLHRIPPGCIIHHLDLNKLNNSIGNLQLMPNREHMQFHAQLQGNMVGANK